MSASKHVSSLRHIILILSKSVFALSDNDAYVVVGLTRPHGSTRGEHAIHCTTDTVFYEGDESFRIRYAYPEIDGTFLINIPHI
jgi:hypothetical protein